MATHAHQHVFIDELLSTFEYLVSQYQRHIQEKFINIFARGSSR